MLRRLLIASSCLLLIACSSPQKQLVGHWTVDPAGIPAGITGTTKTQIEGLTLDLKDDKSFSLGANKVVMAGTYMLTDHAVDMKVATLNGQPVANLGAMASSIENLKATLAADGKKLSMMPSGGQTKQLDFIKAN